MRVWDPRKISGDLTDLYWVDAFPARAPCIYPGDVLRNPHLDPTRCDTECLGLGFFSLQGSETTASPHHDRGRDFPPPPLAKNKGSETLNP